MQKETLASFATQVLKIVGYDATIREREDGGFTVIRDKAECFEVSRMANGMFHVSSVTPPLRPGMKPGYESVGSADVAEDAIRLVGFAVFGSGIADIEQRLLEQENRISPPQHSSLCQKCQSMVNVTDMANLTTCKTCAGKTV